MFSQSLLPLALISTAVYAQTQAQIQSCANSIDLISYESDPTWSTTDNSHYYNATYTFNPTYCTSKIPITKLYLTDQDSNTIYNCPKPSSFDTTGQIYTQCSQTLGFIASAAAAGDPDWAIILALGVKPTFYTIENDFTVNYYTPPTASGTASRRSLTRSSTCLPGYSLCRVTTTLSECVATHSDIYSCGACPYDPAARDCSAITGANDVECRASQCYVRSCLRGYHVSSDGRSCSRGSLRR